MDNSHLKQVKRLSVALFVSGALNIVLGSAFFYWMVKDRPPTPYCELKPAARKQQQTPLAIDHSNSEVIRLFRQLPIEQLLAKLSNTKLVENGYSQRDLALASLVAFHHFDLAKALPAHEPPLQMRTIAYGRFRSGTIAELTVYPGLTDEQFQSIIHYANTERWPFTPKGIFLLIKKQGGEVDPTLADTFFLAPEFLTVETLFNRSEAPVDKNMLLSVLVEGGWEALETFAEQQRTLQDLSSARRQRFLLDYIAGGSSAAAYLLLKTDGDFAAKKLEDRQVLAILPLLTEKREESYKFALELLGSPRSDIVLRSAAERLYHYAGESSPDKFQLQTALQRFAPQSPLVQKREIIAAPEKPQPAKVVKESPKRTVMPPRKDRLYIVQEGDSLWKISRRFKVDIHTLKNHNRLQSDFLKPGTTLRIP